MARVPWNKGKKTGPLSEECKRKLSEALMGREFSDEHRQKISDALKGKPKSESHRRNLCEARRRFFDSDEGKLAAKRQGERMKGHASPNPKGKPRPKSVSLKIRKTLANRTKEEKALWRERLSAVCMGRPAWNKGLSRETDERVEKYCRDGEENHKWLGGISFEPYGIEFNKDLKKAIRKRDNQTCQLCRKTGKSVHHIDYDKKNNDSLNLITLCRSCHGRTNGYRESWDFYFSTLQLERLVIPLSIAA